MAAQQKHFIVNADKKQYVYKMDGLDHKPKNQTSCLRGKGYEVGA
jgi:hypothetical protein